MVTLIGSGNVATWMAQRLQFSEKYRITQVFSRNIDHARTVARYSQAEAINNLSDLDRNSDIYILALSDNAYDEFLPSLPFKLPAAFLTSGTVSCQRLKPFSDQYGVIYPLQTFSKSQDMTDWEVPLCVESAYATAVKDDLWELARTLSDNCHEVSEEQRSILHVAAVFACNFSNAMFSVAHKLLAENNMKFDILLPLLRNTVNKLQTMSPAEAQTGPAVRGDHNVMETQMQSLDDDRLKTIYKLMSELIGEFRIENRNAQ